MCRRAESSCCGSAARRSQESSCVLSLDEPALGFGVAVGVAKDEQRLAVARDDLEVVAGDRPAGFADPGASGWRVWRRIRRGRRAQEVVPLALDQPPGTLASGDVGGFAGEAER